MIRPLLGWPKAALIETCRRFGQDFVEDPSNRSDRFARTGLRRRLADDEPLRALVLREAAAAGSGRADADRQVSRALARIAEIRPDGVVLLDREAFGSIPPEARVAVLAAVLRTAGGNEYGPDPAAVARLNGALNAGGFSGMSLAGCIVRLWRDRLLVCRESERIAPPMPLTEGEWHYWDGRFVARASSPDDPLTIGALGAQGFAALRRHHEHIPSDSRRGRVAGVKVGRRNDRCAVDRGNGKRLAGVRIALFTPLALIV